VAMTGETPLLAHEVRVLMPSPRLHEGTVFSLKLGACSHG